MKIRTLLKSINRYTDVEIVDVDYRRIYWGKTYRMDKDVWNYLVNKDVAEVNPFIFGETTNGDKLQGVAIQIRLASPDDGFGKHGEDT